MTAEQIRQFETVAKTKYIFGFAPCATFTIPATLVIIKDKRGNPNLDLHWMKPRTHDAVTRLMMLNRGLLN